MAEYKSQQINRGSISDILQLLQGFSSGHERARGTMVDKRNALINQLSTTTSLDSLNNQLSQIEEFNQGASISGYDEYHINAGDMKNAYTNANAAYEKAKTYQDGNLGDADALYDKVMGMTWEQAHEELRDLDMMIDGIGGGEQYKFKYKANDQYSGTSLKNALVTRKGIIQNKLKVFEENSGEFLVYNADGTMDEVSRQIYDDLQFKILNPDTQDFSGDLDKAKDLASGGYLKREKEWVAWKEVQQKIANNPASTIDEAVDGVSEMTRLILGQQAANFSMTGDMLLDPGWVDDMVENSKEAANKYNRQYEVYTGEIFQKTPWETPGEDPTKIPGASSVNPVNLTGNNDKKEIEEIEEIEEINPLTLKPVIQEEKIFGLPVPGEVFQKEGIIFKEEDLGLDNLQITLAKHITEDSYNQSIKGTNAIDMDGNSLKILGIDKNGNVKTDKGIYNKTDIKIESLTEKFMPKLVKAKGKWMFYNPVSNKYEEFSENTKNEFGYSEVVTNLPDIYTKDGVSKVPRIQYGKGSNTATYFWYKGKWTELKKGSEIYHKFHSRN